MKKLSTFMFIGQLLAILLVAFSPVAVRAQAEEAADVASVPVADAATHIHDTLDKIIQTTTSVAQVAEKINTYVLEPLAFVLSGNILKAITAGVMQFAIGEANGTGMPQFVVDLQETIRTVNDSQELAFLKDFNRNSNSPFASSIGAAVGDEYNLKNSLEGFWRRNMSTLRQSSNLYNDNYLRGDWSRGGLHAWFALTTRTENNPYTLHQQVQGQLQDLLSHEKLSAADARIKEVGWGNGVMSWCGEFGKSYKTPGQAAPNACKYGRDDYGAGGCLNAYSPDATCPAGQINDPKQGCVTPGANANTGVESSNPGDDCIDADGNHSTIKTPAIVITEQLNKVLGSDQDKIARMGNVGPQVNQILRNLTSVANTVGLARSLLNSSSGGLTGVGRSSSSQPDSRLSQYQKSPLIPGVTLSSVYQEASKSVDINGADARADQYETAWKTIETSAKMASTTLDELATVCATLKPLIDTVRTEKVAPVLKGATDAFTATTALRQAKVTLETKTASGAQDENGETLVLLQSFQTMSPTAEDVVLAQNNARMTSSGATASPQGSLTISGGSIVDQMSLLHTNAVAMKVGCVGAQTQGTP